MTPKYFHLIGIGGIGMSALAELLLADRCEVSGSDCRPSAKLSDLSESGARISYEADGSLLTHAATTVVYSSAIRKDHPELRKAEQLGCSLWHRSDLLAHLIRSYRSLAVTGTHGKTTTSSLLAHVFRRAGTGAGFAVGGILLNEQTNARKGEGDYFIFEADESDGSFLRYHPEGAIVTNIEPDHLDYYQNTENMEDAFRRFIAGMKDPRLLLWGFDCPGLRTLSPPGVGYGFSEGSELRLSEYQKKEEGIEFAIDFRGQRYPRIYLPLFGRHNALNAGAVFGLCLLSGLPEDRIREGLRTFTGVARRCEKKGTVRKVDVIDDYAHHPTEIACLLKGLRERYPDRRIVALFQPHRYTRTSYFFQEFASSFSDADEVCLTDIYSAGEEPIEGLCLEKLARAIEEKEYIPARYVPFSSLEDHFLLSVKPHDVWVTIGAGNITEFSVKAVDRLQNNRVVWRVGVINGSTSPEHHISLISSRFFYENLHSDIYDVVDFTIGQDGRWFSQTTKNDSAYVFPSALFKEITDCDIFIPVVHGYRGEDGMLQGFLSTLQKAYIGPDYMASSLAMHKVWTKEVVKSLGISVGKYLSFGKKEWQRQPEACITSVCETLTFPLFVKPVMSGSTLGVTRVLDKEQLAPAFDEALFLDEWVMVEEGIEGREFEMAVLEGETTVVPKPGEVRTAVRSYDYAAKYSKTPIEKIVEAELPEEFIRKAEKYGREIFRLFGGRGFMRIDFFMTSAGEFVLGEINPMPGCTPRSLFPRMLQQGGVSSEALVDHMIIRGLYHHRLFLKTLRKTIFFLRRIEDVTK